MTADPLLERVVIDPQIAFGKPTIRGTRIVVGLVLELLAGGMGPEEILAEYPQLSPEDIRACLAYAARLTTGSFVEVA